jgi:hypothetical protein
MNGAAMALEIALPYMPSWDLGSLQKETVNFQVKNLGKPKRKLSRKQPFAASECA